MATFVFGSGRHEASPGPLPEAVEVEAGVVVDEWPPEGLDLDTLHRRLMLMLRDSEMRDPDTVVRMSVPMPRRLRGQLAMIARHRGIATGELLAEIIGRYLERYYRGLTEHPAA
jgi:hypothetical protein